MQTSRIPNLFIIGAPKCGTTAISEYLRSHPDVFFSDPKEPHFFCPDINKKLRLKNLDDYLALFAGVENELIVAEGSTSYLISSVAIKNILEFNPDARLVAFVRNPIDQCVSYHHQKINGMEESVQQFENAWRLQEDRANGRNVPAECTAPALLQYRMVAAMGTLIQRFLKQVPPDQRYIIVFDDLKAEPSRVYAELLEFLDLPHDGRNKFPVINEAFKYKAPAVMRTIRRPSRALRKVAKLTQHINGGRPLGIYSRFDRFLDRYTRQSCPAAALTAPMHAELVDTFRGEVDLLSELLNRDLSHWLLPRGH